VHRFLSDAGVLKAVTPPQSREDEAQEEGAGARRSGREGRGPSAGLTDARILLGVVTAAHGIKGEVKVEDLHQSPMALPLTGRSLSEDGRQFEIAALRQSKADEAVVAFFRDRGSQTRRESLKGQRLYVPRTALPATEAGEFYYADLVGLKAEDRSGKVSRHRLRVAQFRRRGTSSRSNFPAARPSSSPSAMLMCRLSISPRAGRDRAAARRGGR